MNQTPQIASVDPAEVAKLSAGAAAWWDPAGPFAPLHRINPVRLAFIRERALARFGRPAMARSPFEGLRLLDIGCGGGLVCEPMFRLGFEVSGGDASPENVEAARAHAQAMGLRIRYRPMREGVLIAKSEPPFDVVLGLEVIEHTASAARFVEDCAQLLAPGGLMILSTLNRTWKAFALAKFGAEYLLRWLPRGSHDWRRFVTPGELASMLAAAGLEAEAPVGVVYDPLAGRWRRSHDCSVNYMIAASRPAVAPLRRLRKTRVRV